MLLNDQTSIREGAHVSIRTVFASLLLGLFFVTGAGAQSNGERVGQSPWEPDDEIGALNRTTTDSRAEILRRIAPDKVYDLAVEHFVGMPSWYPRYQIWMTHTPDGVVIGDPAAHSREVV